MREASSSDFLPNDREEEEGGARKKRNPFWGDKEPKRDTAYYWRLSRRQRMTVEEFADFYCGSPYADFSRGSFHGALAEQLMEETAEHVFSYEGTFFNEHWGYAPGYLCGYESENESLTYRELEFPVEAYVAFLEEVGLDLPREWAHIKPQTVEGPSPIHDEEPAAVEAVAAKDAACESASEEYGRTAGEDVEILDGLTLADFKRYLESNPPLKYVLPIVVKTFLLPEGHSSRTQGMLRMDLNRSAKKGWGTGENGGMADSQARAIEQILLPKARGGSGNIKPLRVLHKKTPEKEK